MAFKNLDAERAALRIVVMSVVGEDKEEDGIWRINNIDVPRDVSIRGCIVLCYALLDVVVVPNTRH